MLLSNRCGGRCCTAAAAAAEEEEEYPGFVTNDVPYGSQTGIDEDFDEVDVPADESNDT
jgi:hypothetical protein